MNTQEDNQSSGRKCPRCGAELPANVSPDLCPRCLLRAGMPTEPSGPATEPLAASGAPARSRGLPQPGQQLGHYRIVRLLGEGGMGAVFDAEDIESGRRVALKVLSQALDAPEARERFFREGRMAASISHPNSVYVFGTEEIGGIPAITMELVAGGTLQDRVRDRGPLPAAEAVDAVLQIIAGLEAAQQVGVLHRDIKPSNCFRETDGTVKIGDFGLSISTTIRTEPALTSAGAFLGTPAFCSPEQLRGDELNVRSDMYSVGATLFYLLTGHTPFEGKNGAQMLATVLEQRAPSPAKYRPDLPRGLAKAVLRCLQKLPSDRFRDYRELTEVLAPYGSAAPTPATLGLRFLAGLLDQLAVGTAGLLVSMLTGYSPMGFLNSASRNPVRLLPVVLPSAAAVLLYYALLEGIWGAAAGKAICRLRVIGRDRNPPGFGRALARAVIYVVLPALPYWILLIALGYKSFLGASATVQVLVALPSYIIFGLLFCTARRRNGFAAVHDLIAGARVVSRSVLASRPLLAAVESPQSGLTGRPMVGPYHVLETLERIGDTEWLLAFDSRLLRKVWIRVVPAGTAPVPPAWRSVGRPGRLRWLAGRRSEGENWDAFEAATGRALLSLVQSPQPWRQVRYWLYDLAGEIAASGRDSTMPEVLAANRVWITADGRAKLLDFPAPGIPHASYAGGGVGQSANEFLGQVAAMALGGRQEAAPGAELGIPLPVHARKFLNQLPAFPDTKAVADFLKPLLQRMAEVTRLRRVAIAVGCLVLPVFGGMSFLLGAKMLDQFSRSSPGMMELSSLLQQRSTASSFLLRNQSHPTDRLYAIYIAGHYRSVVTNEAIWTGVFTMSLIKGDARKFAEQSIADYPAPTVDELREADTAIKPPPTLNQMGGQLKQPTFLLGVTAATMVMYVAFPALVAALLFRGGLVLLIARVTFVRKDGELASRLRLFLRALVTWSPLVLAIILAFFLGMVFSQMISIIAVLLLMGAATVVSLLLPDRGIPDRLAGTWPVPR